MGIGRKIPDFKSDVPGLEYGGAGEVIDCSDGMAIPAAHFINGRDVDFRKMWLRPFLDMISEISNQKMVFCLWLIDQFDRDNRCYLTQRQMAEQSGISYPTVNRALAALQDSGFLIKFGHGNYMINPKITANVRPERRMALVWDFEAALKDREDGDGTYTRYSERQRKRWDAQHPDQAARRDEQAYEDAKEGEQER